MPSLEQTAPDKNGVFTGSVVSLPFREAESGGAQNSYYPTAFYSSVWGTAENRQETISIARALKADLLDANGKPEDPFLTDWTKYSTNEDDPNNNPEIIIHQPPELNLFSFRDPYIFTLPDDPRYYLLVSGGVKGKNGNPEGVLLLFVNDGKDLTKNWVRANSGDNFFFSGPVETKEAVTDGGDFECGAVYRLTDRIGTTNGTPFIIIFGQDADPSSLYGRSVFYVLGQIERRDSGIRFNPLSHYKDRDGTTVYRHMDLNPEFVFYAAHTLPTDTEQRKYMMGWLNIGSQADDGKRYDWAGVHSTPRFLYAFKDHGRWEVAQEPTMVTALREPRLLSETFEFTDQVTRKRLKGVHGRYLNIDAAFAGKDLDRSKFGISVVCGESRCLDIALDQGALKIGEQRNIDFALPRVSGKVGINAYLDGSVLEVFVSRDIKGVAVPIGVYSAPLPNLGNLTRERVSVFAEPGMSATINAYGMQSCWIDPPASENRGDGPPRG